MLQIYKKYYYRVLSFVPPSLKPVEYMPRQRPTLQLRLSVY